jgi:hypothetical protein
MKTQVSMMKSIFIVAPVLFLSWMMLVIVCHIASALFVVLFAWLHSAPVIGGVMNFMFSSVSLSNGSSKILWLSVGSCCLLSGWLLEHIMDFFNNAIPVVTVKVFIFLAVSIVILWPSIVGVKFDGDYMGEIETYLLVGLSSYFMLSRAKELQRYDNEE